MAISFPTALAKQQIDSMRAAIGRACIFNTVTTTECTASNCDRNPITNTSTNPFCPVCSGTFYIESFVPVTISGHITWYPEQMQWWAAGQHFDGDVRIQIEYTESNLATIANTDNVIVDDKIVEIKKTTNRGFQTFNRIILECRERDRV